MDTTTARKLSNTMRQLPSDDIIKLLVTADTDPDAARSLWGVVLTTNTTDARFRTVLEWVLESVLIDYVTNHMAHSDDFAVVIGRRIATILETIGQPQESGKRSEQNQHPRTA